MVLFARVFGFENRHAFALYSPLAGPSTANCAASVQQSQSKSLFCNVLSTVPITVRRSAMPFPRAVFQAKYMRCNELPNEMHLKAATAPTPTPVVAERQTAARRLGQKPLSCCK